MRAITLHPEWTIPIVSDHPAAKRSENRTWPLPRTAVDVPIALHSGARIGGSDGWGPGDSVWVRSRFGRGRPDVRSARATRGAAATMAMVETAKDAGWPIMDRWKTQIADDGYAGATDERTRTVAQLHAISNMSHPGHVVAVVWFSGSDQAVTSPWDVAGEGWHHWRIKAVTALLEPIPCVGHEQLWNLPPEVEAEIKRQVGRRR